jgi:uncharacterized protein (UPF0333 family)
MTKEIEDKKNIVSKFQLKGSALIFTMFILAGMLIVAMSGSYLILTGIIAGGIQSQSTKAYFAAESGAENILWQFRKDDANYGNIYKDTGTPLMQGVISENIDYNVYHTSSPNGSLHNYTSIGTYNNIRRSVEISF